MCNKDFNRKGFTMVEIIVTLAIMSILLSVVGSMYLTGTKVFTSSEAQNTAKYIGDSAFSYMRDRLEFATDMEVIEPGRSVDNGAYDYVFDLQKKKDSGNNDLDYGYLLSGNKGSQTNIYGESYYGNFSIDYHVKVSGTNATSFHLTVVVYNTAGEKKYSTESDISCINLKKNGKTIKMTDKDGASLTTGCDYINPGISYNKPVTTSSARDENNLIERMNKLHCMINSGSMRING